MYLPHTVVSGTEEMLTILSRINHFFCKVKVMKNGEEHKQACIGRNHDRCPIYACVMHKEKQLQDVQSSRQVFQFGLSFHSSSSLIPVAFHVRLAPYSTLSWVYLVYHFFHHPQNVIPDFDRKTPPLTLSGSNLTSSQMMFSALVNCTR